MEMTLRVQREGKFFVVSSKSFGITTQGESLVKALKNFQDAFLLCLYDPDWRQMHGIGEAAYKELLKKEEIGSAELPRTSFNVSINEMVTKMIEDVTKAPNPIRPTTC